MLAGPLRATADPVSAVLLRLAKGETRTRPGVRRFYARAPPGVVAVRELRAPMAPGGVEPWDGAGGRAARPVIPRYEVFGGWFGGVHVADPARRGGVAGGASVVQAPGHGQPHTVPHNRADLTLAQE